MFTANLKNTPRHFVAQNCTINTWQDIALYYNQLTTANITSVKQLETWIANYAELQAVISEEACWRQIRMTRDTTDKTLEDAYTFWCTDIQPPIMEANNSCNILLMQSAYINELNKEEYGIFIRTIKKDVELFRTENVALQSEESVLAQQFGSINAQMTIEVDGQTYTMQQAVKFLMQSNRDLRKSVYDKIATRRLQDKDKLNELFDKLLNIRNTIAQNAGYKNYRDYKFVELSRFDYTVKDCNEFAAAVKKYIVPLCEKIYEAKRKNLNLPQLYVYDVEAEPEGQTPLYPFKDSTELINKSIAVFNKVNPFFGDCLTTMQQRAHLDLESRIGKAPGGYNCPLAETGVPFIFMNAASTADDVVTMMHEGGHAIHSFVCHPLRLSFFKEYPIEVAELASMSMELFSMDYWETFYPNQQELMRAKIEELERVLTILPWIATIDQFQHWLYTNPGHSIEQRTAAWQSILQTYSVSNINYSEYAEYRANFWQKQLHLFEVPFYYIEYGIAQLGALGMWIQYKANKDAAIKNYINVLSLGGTKSLNELYQVANLELNFGDAKIKELSAFVEQELNALL